MTVGVVCWLFESASLFAFVMLGACFSHPSRVSIRTAQAPSELPQLLRSFVGAYACMAVSVWLQNAPEACVISCYPNDYRRLFVPARRGS